MHRSKLASKHWDPDRKTVNERAPLIQTLEDDEVEAVLREEEEVPKSCYRPRLFYVILFLMVFNSARAFTFPASLKIIQVQEQYFKLSHKDANVAASKIAGYQHAVFAFFHILTISIIACLSNRFGRKPLFMCAVVSCAAEAATYLFIPPLWYLYAVTAIHGILDSTWMLGAISVADVTTNRSRAFGFSMLNVTYNLPLRLLAGWISDHYGYDMSFKVAVVSMGAALLVLLLTPEPNTDKDRAPVSWSDFNPMGSWPLIFHNRVIFVLSMMLFLDTYLGHAVGSVWVFYVDLKYSLSTLQQSIFSSVGGASTLSAALLTKFLVPVIGERISSVTVQLMAGAALLSIPFVPQWFLLIPILFLRGMAVSVFHSSIISYCTRYFVGKPKEQVQFLSMLSATGNMAGLLSDLTVPQLWALSTRLNPTSPDLVFLCGAGLSAAVTLITCIFFLANKAKPPKEDKLRSEISDSSWMWIQNSGMDTRQSTVQNC